MCLFILPCLVCFVDGAGCCAAILYNVHYNEKTIVIGLWVTSGVFSYNATLCKYSLGVYFLACLFVLCVRAALCFLLVL
jgi:hypothetical protein